MRIKSRSRQGDTRMQASDPLRAKREAEVGKAIRGAPTSQSPVRPATFMSSKTTKPLSSSESWHSLAQEGLYPVGPGCTRRINWMAVESNEARKNPPGLSEL